MASGKLKDLGKLPWVGISQFSSLSKITAELWREINISPKKVAESDHLAVILELVAAGVGAALVREEEALAWEAKGASGWCPICASEPNCSSSTRRTGPAIRCWRPC
ncbi:LysR substrate binding domain [Chromobacterium violaceum]|uniref:LysR substrate binding domain n=1 Tax=Chromobacterium violaceum TaxID=536 RepID=A0A3S4LJU1_CHRVL|nr:LysR substrate binding domain [Chromobacterium violaceum]